MPSRNRWRIVAVCATIALALFAKRVYDQRAQSLERIARCENERQQTAWLDKTVEIKLTGDVPLSEWLADLSRQAGVKLLLHKSDEYRQAMPDVCLPLPPQSARDALQAVALEVPLRWRPHDGKLVVQLLANHELAPVEIQTYLLRPSLSAAIQHQIAEAVETYIEPETWERVGGRSTLLETPGQLVIVTHYDTHLRIRSFLDKLQTHLELAATIPVAGLSPDDDRLQPAELQSQFQNATKARRALEQKISLNVVEMPLKTVQARLSQELDVLIVASYNQLSDRGIQPDDVVTLNVSNMRAATVIDLLFSGKGVTVIPLQGSSDVLHIVPYSRKISQECLSVVAYPLADFVRGNAEHDLAQLAKVLQSVVDPANWQDVGGWGSVKRIDKSLLITQLPDNHLAIERCLLALREVRSGRHKRSPLPSQTSVRGQIVAKLQEPIALKYERVMLHEVLADLQRRTGLSFQIHNSIYDAGATPQMAVTCDLPAAPLSRNLPQLLSKAGLHLRVHDDYLSVISRLEQDFGEEAVTEVIDARPLLRRSKCTFGDFGQLLMSAVGQSSWRDLGGKDALHELDGLLVVRQTPTLLPQVLEIYQALENDWHRDQSKRQRSSFISGMQKDNFNLLTRLYAVDDLLKPRGKFSVDELKRELNIPPIPLPRPRRAVINTLQIHCNRYLVARLYEEQLEPLETTLNELRMEK